MPADSHVPYTLHATAGDVNTNNVSVSVCLQRCNLFDTGKADWCCYYVSEISFIAVTADYNYVRQGRYCNAQRLSVCLSVCLLEALHENY